MGKFLKEVKAIFVPSQEHIDTLKFELIPFIGKEYNFQYQFIIEEGAFKGEWALMIHPPFDADFTEWVPESDLKILEYPMQTVR